MYTPLFLLTIFTISWGKPMDDPAWREYKLKFGKFYAIDEDAGRYQVWKQHLKEILEHNAKSTTFKKGVNNFTDMTHEEFRSKMGGCYKVPKEHLEGNVTSKGSTFLPPCNVDIPAAVNWVEQGYVTPVKNQGQCGSCWAFSTTGSLEGQTFRKTGRLPELSEQNLVDCSKSYGNQGCRGGWMDYAFQYIRDNRGIDSESGYPYYARELGYCYYRSNYNTACDSGFTDIPTGDENALKIAVATVGPISVAIDATHRSFMSYRSGVYFENACGNGLRNLDHAVLVVGYGNEGGYDYWLVKNSWGTSWGEGGYIKMARGYNNQCGIATKGSYPLV